MKMKICTEFQTKVNSDVLKNYPPTFNGFFKNNGSVDKASFYCL